MSETATLPAQTAQLDCPECRTSITYFDVENSTHYACPGCQTYFEYQDPKPPRFIGKFLQGPEFVRQVMPLGATGRMPDGRTYQVVGYSARSEAKSNEYRWGEYALFSAPDQYAQLAVYEGHWTFIRPTTPRKLLKPNTRFAYVEQEDGRYELYNKYQPRLHYAVGEFDYDIRSDEKITVLEFINPPYMLVREQGPGQAPAWYRAEHVEPDVVAEAFSVVPHYQMPWRSGVGAIQPAPGGRTWTPLLYLTLALSLLVILTQALISAVKPSKVLLSEFYVTQPDTARTAPAGQSAVIVTPAFQVDGPTALHFELQVNVDNQWTELPVALINEQTGQRFEFTKNIEFYRGYEDGEHWNEGSTSADATLSRVPSGRYHLNIYPVSGSAQSLTLQLKLTQNAPLRSNLLILLLLLFTYPFIQYVRRRHHEQQRWANSDYGPESA